MKRRLLPIQLKKGLLVIPAAAMMLGAASHGAQIGINFQDNWSGTPYAPLTDAAGAFGIPLANWYNAPTVFNSGAGGGVGTSGTFAVPGGGDLQVVWSCKNTYSLYAAIPSTGDSQVIYGYLDDSDYGYTVKLSGLRGFASSFTIKTIAATDSGSDFMPVSVFSSTQTNTLEYLANYTPSFANGLAGDSTVSPAFPALNANDSLTIQGLAKTNSQIRSCLAGIIIEYTPSASNPPLIEANPQPPTGLIFPGGSFSLTSLASGGPPLHYQWRKDGTEIPGANFASYTNSSAANGDTGGYDVVVTNAFGSVTSTVAQVTIQNVVAPVITQSPLSQSVYPGYPVSFAVSATGGQLAYLWKSNGVAIPNATNPTLSIASAASSDAGTYTVEVSNPVGPTVTASATLTVKVPVAGSYEAVVAGTKPEFWLRYSETGPVLQDTAANAGSLAAAGNGLYLGSTIHPVAGALVASANQAATLSGGKISVPFNAAMNPAGAFTVDCWIKPASSGTGMIIQEMINGENPGNPNDRTGWGLRLNNTGLRYYVGDVGGAPFYYYYTTADGIITPGVWQHVAVVYDNVAPSIYVNGVLIPTTVTRQDGVAMTQPEIDAIRIIPNFAAPLIIGDRGYGGWTFSGSVDEVAIYPSALTPAQVLAHYQNGVSPTPSPAYDALVTGEGAVEYLRLSDTLTLSPATNSGTLGAAWTGSYKDGGNTLGSPMIAKGATGPRPATYPGFDSGNTAVAMTNGYSTTLPLGVTVNTVTMTCWIKREADFSTDDLSWLTWLGSSQSGGFHLNEASSQPTPGELRYHWDGSQWDWASGLIVPENVWTFCAMVLTPTNVTMYMSDGGTLKQASRLATHTAHTLNLAPGFGGGQQDRMTRNYIGQMDESTVHFRALSQSEITSMFLVGTGAPFQVDIVPGGIIADTKPIGTPHNGVNYLTTWLASSADAVPVTRTGVEVFSTANNSQIKVAADPDFDSPVGTFAFWMKADAPIPGPGNEAAILIDRRTTAGTVIALNDAGNIFVQCAGGANSFFAGYLPDGLWHHVAVTYDQSASGSIEVFVDGVSNGSQVNSAAWSWPTAQPIELGRSHDTYWKRYDGQMDDFRIYSRILTQTEIASIVSSGALVDTAALKLRYNFDTAGIGQSVTWPFGTLLSSPVLGPSAIWTPVPGAVPPTYPFVPTENAKFFRATP